MVVETTVNTSSTTQRCVTTSTNKEGYAALAQGTKTALFTKTAVLDLLESQLAIQVINVYCHPIYSGRQTCGRTSRGHTGAGPHKISPPSFCGACVIFSREKDSAVPFPRRPRSRIWCTNELIVLHLLGIFFFFFFFSSLYCEEKSQFVLLHRDSNSRPNVRRFRGCYQLNTGATYSKTCRGQSLLLYLQKI